MAGRTPPTRAQVEGYLADHRNWGRWGDKGDAGTINLITDEKRIQAAGLVRTGRTVSLSRPMPVTPSPENPEPANLFLKTLPWRDQGGVVVDFLTMTQHGFATTHIDALCHTWDRHGMWEGRDPAKELGYDGAHHGSIDHWSGGIMTRGVLLDIPKYRGEPYSTLDTPIHGWELEGAASQQGVSVGPGDAIVVHCGREAYTRSEKVVFGGEPAIPGLHASCLPFIRDNDLAVLVWDMEDMNPNEYGLAWTIHGAIFAYGLAVVDNALVEPLAQACAEEGRHDFMLTVNPLVINGGTGSPVNPIAVF